MVSKAQYKAIKYSLTGAEKKLIGYYERQWFISHTVPTVEEVWEYLKKDLPRVRLISVNYYLARYPVRKALEERGIPWQQHTQEELTDRQRAAAITVMNFADERSIADKLDALGILPATYYAWLNDPQFNNFVNSLADQNKINIRPAAVAEFTKKVHSGDWNALKFFLEVTGEFSNNNNMPNPEILLRMIVEVIQTHVKDPETIIAIAQGLKLAFANRTLEVVTQPQELEGSYTSSELEIAKSQLGIG